MAIENFGLVFAAGTDEALSMVGSHSVRIGAGDAGQTFVRFQTMSAGPWNASVTVRAEWQGVKRATEDNPATEYGKTWVVAEGTFPLDGIGHEKVGNLHEWAVPLDLVTPAMHGASWSFADRTYDELHLQLAVRMNYAEGNVDADGNTSSPWARKEAWVGYIPTYSVGSVWYDLEALHIELTRSEGWERLDDRWSVVLLHLGGRDALGNENLWGQVADGISIPLRQLASMPSGGMEAFFELRFNANFKAIGSTLFTLGAIKQVEDRSTCNTPRLTVTLDGTTATVKVEDSGDRGVPITHAVVSLRGSTSQMDTKAVRVGFSATFRAVPALSATFEAYGTDDLDSTNTSRLAVETVTLPPDNVVQIVDAWTGKSYDFGQNPAWSMSLAQDKVVEKLHDRERSSVWYGSGFVGTASLSALMEDVHATVEELAGIEDAVLRLPNGYRRRVCVESVSTGHAPEGATVSLKLTEVV